MDFTKNVLHRSNEGLVIVQMSAEWCSPCRMIKPVLKDACKAADVPFIVIDVEDNPEVGKAYGVRSVPHIVAFHKGEVISKFDRSQPIPVWIQLALALAN